MQHQQVDRFQEYPMLFRTLSVADCLDWIQTYNEILVHRHGNNNGAACHNSIWYVRRLGHIQRGVFIQALYYLYTLSNDSVFRASYHASMSAFYFAVAFSLAMEPWRSHGVSDQQLAELCEVSLDTFLSGKQRLRLFLGELYHVDVRTLGEFTKLMVWETCYEGDSDQWPGHERIRRVRMQLLSHLELQQRQHSPALSETDESPVAPE